MDNPDYAQINERLSYFKGLVSKPHHTENPPSIHPNLYIEDVEALMHESSHLQAHIQELSMQVERMRQQSDAWELKYYREKEHNSRA